MKSTHAERIQFQRERIRAFLAGTERKLVVDIQGLSHRETCLLLYGGRWQEFLVGVRFLVTLALYACPLPGVKNWVYRLMGYRIGKGVYIAPGCFLDVSNIGLLTIGDSVVMGMGSAIATHERHRDILVLGRVDIGDGVLLGGLSVVRAGTRIGAGAELDMMLNVSRHVAPGERVLSSRNGRPVPRFPED